MIQTRTLHRCSKCLSTNLGKNGTNPNGKQKYHCKDCNCYGVLNAQSIYTEQDKEKALKVYQERASLRGVQRVTGISRPTLTKWLKEKTKEQADLKESLEQAKVEDVLELDELWSFVGKKRQKRWVWIAQCRRTRQVIGDRSARTCARLYNKIAQQYKRCRSFSDSWEAYAKVFSEKKHQQLGKEKRETNHVERFNNTLRQRLGRYVRKTLSFSKKDTWHHLVTKFFMFNYNLSQSA